MKTEIEVEVQYSESDFVRGMNFAHASNRSASSFSIISGVSILVGFYFFYFYFSRSPGSWRLEDWAFVGFGLILGIAGGYLLGNFSIVNSMFFSKQFEEHPLLRESYTIVFSENGIDSRSASFQSNLKWNVILRALETEEDYYFFTGPTTALFVPIRVFNTHQRASLKDLAKNMIGARSEFLQ